jgi:hypothetical protein
MNDYVRGAFEALNWVHILLASVDSEKDLDHVNRAVREVESAMSDIRDGIAVDFRHRLKR